MAALLNNTAFRMLLLAAALACAAALTASTARGEVVDSEKTHSSVSLPHASCLLPTAILAEEWSWSEFVKFWRQQGGSMNGVLGTVLLVGGAAVLMILWKGK